MSSSSHAAWTTKVLSAILSLLVTTLVTTFVTKLLRDGETLASSTGSLSASLRACVVEPSGETLEDIGGLAAVKDELRRLVLLPLQHPRIFFGGPSSLRPPQGILLHGPPGTGKTMLARALASESQVPFLALSPASLESKWAGETPKLLEAAFRLARDELAPCVVFFDELDGLAKTRHDMDAQHAYTLKTEFLRNLDGIAASQAPVLVLGCTNCPSSLDPAMRRRFPREIHVGKPDETDRLAILQRLGRDEVAPPDVTVLRAVAKATDGATGSDLAALFARASARRFTARSLQRALRHAPDGDAVLAKVGPITKVHWDAVLP